jgi:membrane-associated phospholipid phosphatase
MKRALGLGLAGMIGGLSTLSVAVPEARAQDRVQMPGWAFGSVGGEIALGAATAAAPAFYFLPQRRTKWGAYAEHPRDPDFVLLSNIAGGIGGIVFAGGFGYMFEWGYLAAKSNNHQAPVNALRTSVVDLEAVMLSTGLVQLIKRVSGRCRPWAWAESAQLCQARNDDDHAAFPSGHTAPVAAIAGARLVLALRSDLGQYIGARYAAFGTAEVFSIAAAYLRIRAGAHSWEDVTGGWLLGHATGALLMLAHPMIDAPPSTYPYQQSSSALSRAPVFFSWGGVF